MKRVVTVRNVKIGEGIPKICVPIVGTTREEIIAEARNLHQVKADLLEWRVDWFEDVLDLVKVKEAAKELREVVKDIPILFTFRSLKEGGEKEIEVSTYVEMNKEMAATGLVDLIDVELFTGEEYVRDITQTAHSYGVKVVCSSHEFHMTPSKEEMVARLIKMQELDADLPKLAVMPESKRDVLELLFATNEMYEQHANRPIITMSMKGIGAISRVAGEVFGSALTFGSVTTASAPGQIEVEKLSTVLQVLHESL